MAVAVSQNWLLVAITYRHQVEQELQIMEHLVVAEDIGQEVVQERLVLAQRALQLQTDKPVGKVVHF